MSYFVFCDIFLVFPSSTITQKFGKNNSEKKKKKSLSGNIFLLGALPPAPGQIQLIGTPEVAVVAAHMLRLCSPSFHLMLLLH